MDLVKLLQAHRVPVRCIDCGGGDAVGAIGLIVAIIGVVIAFAAAPIARVGQALTRAA